MHVSRLFLNRKKMVGRSHPTLIRTYQGDPFNHRQAKKKKGGPCPPYTFIHTTKVLLYVGWAWPTIRITFSQSMMQNVRWAWSTFINLFSESIIRLKIDTLPPVGRINFLLHVTVKSGMRPIYHFFYQSVLHRIIMNIIHVGM